MSERAPVIGVVDNLNGLSWKYDPSWIEHFVRHHGSFEEFAAECRRQLDLALVNAKRTLEILSEPKSKETAK